MNNYLNQTFIANFPSPVFQQTSSNAHITMTTASRSAFWRGPGEDDSSDSDQDSEYNDEKGDVDRLHAVEDDLDGLDDRSEPAGYDEHLFEDVLNPRDNNIHKQTKGDQSFRLTSPLYTRNTSDRSSILKSNQKATQGTMESIQVHRVR